MIKEIVLIRKFIKILPTLILQILKMKTTIQHLAIINFCGITKEKAELEAFLDSRSIDLLLGIEYHLDESLTNTEIFPTHYHVYMKDRNINGGGVFLLVEESIPSSQM